jgi:hypothetical protein
MFLEKCGQFFFLRMRPSFFFILIAFPFVTALFFISQIINEMEELESRFRSALAKEKLALERKERKERFLNRYSNANPYFLDEQIESLTFLEEEKQKLTSLSLHPAIPESQEIKNRLTFLDQNRLLFREGKIESSTQLKETEERQQQPVEIDEADLKKLLSLIEDIPIESHQPVEGTPQILVKEFRLKKQEAPFHREIFEIEMNLLKREFNK